MPKSASLQSFRECIRNAARHWFDLVLKNHAAETIYAFALYTDDDAMGICHAANSEEGLARKVAETLQRYKEPISPEQLAQYRWCTSEWAYEDGRSGFPELNQFDVEGLRQEVAKEGDDFFFRFTTVSSDDWRPG